ncbi:hypothetical protein MLD38_039409 [Melastoma candidum]|uniref:Uncharacterized protein n=1 Tax=Melastoma candidum TaxID=119954 RepID=A0ACB9L2R0_9MYRT|nr:hypothetical protein MLD38_039409 [Melastoma candidum]
MEMERLTDFPHSRLDRRPRKRLRLGWDVPDAPQIRSTAKWEKELLVKFWNAGTERKGRWLRLRLFVA